ncbi:Tubulin-specific chaperone A [Dendrobium catenatum]|uniref:Tubulin-specific chaperone A n=2 Tax=Dendrobium catenatum TaxID=906689 RepID=A0A2I0X1W0_9ASPA|nr:Tubulin-specific chaperone A [Dendrobium catenatum]
MMVIVLHLGTASVRIGEEESEWEREISFGLDFLFVRTKPETREEADGRDCEREREGQRDPERETGRFLCWRFRPLKGAKRDREGTKRLIMATLRQLKIKTGTSNRVLKELRSYEKEVKDEAAKTADMKEKGADPYDLKQQENVLAESRMMIPDCLKRLEASLADLKATLEEVKECNQEGSEIAEAERTISELEPLFRTA